ncbi:MAG: sigma-70 family RNA polymerase sigma factor [Alistipes sp.]|nr:sigma-70 family RNA polymerase sigma factor [Alistipes sp.]
MEMNLTDEQIKDALISGDVKVTEQFLLRCRPLLISIVRHKHPEFAPYVDYTELSNEVYFHLMENDAHRLRTYKAKSSIYGWMKVVVTHLLQKKLIKMVVKDTSSDHLLDKVGSPSSTDSQIEATIDSNALLSKMPNHRYATVLQRLIIDDAPTEEVAAEMDVTPANLYNIKSRALKAIAKIIIKENKKTK